MTCKRQVIPGSEDYGVVFKHPSTIIVSGPTGCGKTFFVTNVLRHKLIYPEPQRVVVIYAKAQPLYDEWRQLVPHIEFFQDDYNMQFNPKLRNLLIIDDQMLEAGSTNFLAELFTKGSHHDNLTVIYLVQNVYDKGRAMRTASLNSQYITVFKNNRDKTQLDTLCRQMFPKSPNVLSAILDDESARQERPYIVIDLRAETPEIARLRSGIFRKEPLAFYQPVVQDKKGCKRKAPQSGAGVSKPNRVKFMVLDD